MNEEQKEIIVRDCPYCRSKHVEKAGYRDQEHTVMRYKCQACGKKHSRRVDTGELAVQKGVKIVTDETKELPEKIREEVDSIEAEAKGEQMIEEQVKAEAEKAGVQTIETPGGIMEAPKSTLSEEITQKVQDNQKAAEKPLVEREAKKDRKPIIQVNDEIKTFLDSKKIIPQEPYDRVLMRLLKLDKVKA